MSMVSPFFMEHVVYNLYKLYSVSQNTGPQTHDCNSVNS